MGEHFRLMLQDIGQLLTHCQRLNAGTDPNSISYIRRQLLYYANVLHGNEDILMSGSPLLRELVQSVDSWKEWAERIPVRTGCDCCTPAQLQVELEPSEGGRRKYDVPKESLEYYRELGCTWVEIAQMFGVSERTIHRRVAEYGIESAYSDISDADLCHLVQELQIEHENVGCVLMHQLVRGRGHCVQRSRISKTLKEIDPIGTALRWGALVSRRTYQVSFGI